MESIAKKKEELKKVSIILGWKNKVVDVNVDEELEISTPNDRSIEWAVLMFAYSLKLQGMYFRRETRGSRVFIIRDE